MNILWSIIGISVPMIVVLTYHNPWIAAAMVAAANLIGFVEGKLRKF